MQSTIREHERRALTHQRENINLRVMMENMTIGRHVLQMALLTDTNEIPQSLSSVQDGAELLALSPRSGNRKKLQVMLENVKIRQHVLQMALLIDTNAIPESLS